MNQSILFGVVYAATLLLALWAMMPSFHAIRARWPVDGRYEQHNIKVVAPSTLRMGPTVVGGIAVTVVTFDAGLWVFLAIAVTTLAGTFICYARLLTYPERRQRQYQAARNARPRYTP